MTTKNKTITEFSVQVKRQFDNTLPTTIVLAKFGGVSNDAVELSYISKDGEGNRVQQVVMRNTGSCPDPITISYIYKLNNQALGVIERTPVPLDGSKKLFLDGEIIYFTPSGEIDTEFSPVVNVDSFELQDLSITIDALTYSFDLNNKNINGESNVILIEGVATIVEA